MQKFRPTPFTVAFGEVNKSSTFEPVSVEPVLVSTQSEMTQSSASSSNSFEQIYIEEREYEQEPKTDSETVVYVPVETRTHYNDKNSVFNYHLLSLLRWVVILQIVIILLVIYRMV